MLLEHRTERSQVCVGSGPICRRSIHPALFRRDPASRLNSFAQFHPHRDPRNLNHAAAYNVPFLVFGEIFVNIGRHQLLYSEFQAAFILIDFEHLCF